MKKIMSMLLVLCLCLSAAGCKQAAETPSGDAASGVQSQTTAQSKLEAAEPEQTVEPDQTQEGTPVSGQPMLPDGLTQLPMAPGEAYACEVWMGESSETFSFSVMDYTVEPSARDGYEVRTVTMLLGSFDGADPYTEFVFFDLGENLNPMFDSGVIVRDGEELDFTVLSCETVNASAGFDHVVVQQTLSVEVPAGYEHMALVPMNFKPVGSGDGEFADLVNSDSLWFLLGTPTAGGVSCGGELLQCAAATADTVQLYSYADGPGAELGYGENYNEPIEEAGSEDLVEDENNWLPLNMERSMLEKTRGDAHGALVGVQLVDDSDPSAAVFRIVIEHTNLPADTGVRVFVYDSWDEYPVYEDEVLPGDGTTEITCTLDLNAAVFPLAFNAHIHSPNLPEDIPLCGLVESIG